MKKFKKALFGALTVAAAVLATACSSSKSSSSSKGYTPSKSHPLTIQFVPSQAASTLEAKAKPLEKILSKKLGVPVKISMSTDYNTVVEAMKSKKVDVGFLPPDGYVMAHKQKAADVLLQALRYGIKQPGGKETNKLVKAYRSEILVKKGSKIKSWKDLKGKKIAVQNATSSAGYIFPIAELKEKGLDLTKKGNANLVTVTGHDQAVLDVLNGDVDAAFTFEDARNAVLADQPNIMKKVVPIYFTKSIPNDTISVRSDMSSSFRKKLSKAFESLRKDKKSLKIIESIYRHEGYTPSKDSDFNIVRKYDKMAAIK
ncbi:phosphate/phosphite/phosphonate ABC transporter substrate-binding protein [Lactobacillus delbrueckii subsp. bulgaricus]|uniref:phosphate/phosphite/phosphonate ABC transporter substrate-binding protein n=1 Tax=Lactobacillus delbrueckii TaxID=1584 RepID=UPI0021A382D2|nr:phosphate/phosphite/phosphonate ABC transporter substrate-binding protein [Lactobacillus delbrueckii]MCT3466026.1 phosphate/phosphite/phosphonate ABC transporter substrate-binding protein [Lactobacillus delbrueckii subsp. bulgaricus]MCT3470575.1 phosphate/phosphite/phosphonate ABC transporter substrate-binding protein [Lactobacillus delbrueckii subsp. bulgaricus]MDA3784233.1 phosphate/phosphite/phosphonate ABC transporter substrate-binding protein [Lactobacillus delbrueckii]MDA3796562.1 phos